MSKVNQTRFVTDESQVPAGYVPLTSVTRWDTPEHRVFRRRVAAAYESGKIRSMKLVRSASEMRTGKVWVHEADFKAWRDAAAAAGSPAAVAGGTDRPIDASAEAIFAEARALRTVNMELTNKIGQLLDAFADLQAAIELHADSRRPAEVEA